MATTKQRSFGYVEEPSSVIISFLVPLTVLSLINCKCRPTVSKIKTNLRLYSGLARWIRLGDLDLQNTTEDANPQDVRIVRTYVHPEYRSSSHYHDIALFKMAEEVSLAIDFKAACLHVGKNLPVNTLQATGWGKMGYFGDKSSHLMKVKLGLVNHSTCAKRYANVANTRRLKNGILDEYQMCAGNVEGGDTCLVGGGSFCCTNYYFRL